MVVDSEITILKEVDIPDATISLRSDNIIHVHYKKDTTLDLDLQATMREIYKKIADNKRHKFVFTADEGFILTKEARENSKIHRDSTIMAYAIIANNLAYRIIANFVLKVNRPEVPYKLFASVEEGVKWLKNL